MNLGYVVLNLSLEPFIHPYLPLRPITSISGNNTRRILVYFWYVFHVISRAYAEMFNM